MRAKARKTIKTAKRTSWQQYVSKLNSRTPAKKIWDRIRKNTGKNKNKKHVHIKSNGNICSTTKDISNALGENFQKKKTLLVQTIPKLSKHKTGTRERASKFYATKS